MLWYLTLRFASNAIWIKISILDNNFSIKKSTWTSKILPVVAQVQKTFTLQVYTVENGTHVKSVKVFAVDITM